MKYSRIILGGLVAFTTTAHAMPTPEQTKKVEPLVMDLMRDDQAALKSGKKTRVEVAESAMELAEKAESEAAKLLLMKGAFNLYVRAGEFDKAIEALQSLQTAIPDIPPANVANIIEASLRVVSRKNGGQLYRLLDETKTRMRYTNEAASLEKSVKRNPADRTLRLKLAEHYAYLGKWDLALENFAAADGKVGAIAKSERGGEAATEKIADFWWTYPTGKAAELVKCFRTHAAKLYEEAIAAGAITGLNKVQAERRIEEAKGYGENIFDGTGMGLEELVYKIGDGEKLEFVKCPAGTFIMGYEDLGDAPQEHAHDRFKRHKVTITKPFLFSKKLVTYGQLEALVKLTNGEAAKGTILSQWRFGEQNVLPIGEREKIVDALGGKQMCVWQYDRKSVEIIAKALTKKFSSKIPKGYVFRLPTEAEWEYVAKAGKGDKGVFGRYLLGKHVEKYIVDESVAWNEVVKHYPLFQTKEGVRLRNNFGYKVATKSPNEWGVFDLYDKRLSEATMDIINRGGPKGWGWFWFNYEDTEVDPWRYEEQSCEQGAFRGNVIRGHADRNSNSGAISAGKWVFYREDQVPRFRFVIAPDTTQLNKYPRKNSNQQTATSSNFKTGVKPGTITTLKIADDCDIEFAYCPAGSFKMGYAGVEKIAPLHDVTISRPFWMSKRKITKRQFVKVGVPSEDKDIPANVNSPGASIEKFSRLMNEKYAKLLPRGYVFRVATEAEYEYVSKAEAKKGDPRLLWGFMQENVHNPWGVEDLFRPRSKLVFQDRVPAYESKSLTHFKGSETLVTMIDYSKQPKKDPLMWCENQGSRYLRREIAEEAKLIPAKLTAATDGGLCDSVFYLVAAPAVDSLNKFILK